MKKKERKSRFALTMLLSIFVFCIISIAAIIAIVAVYVLVKIGAISSVDQRVEPLNILLFTGAISITISFFLTALTSKFSMKPVNKAVNLMNRLASGDFKARLEYGKPIGLHPTFIEISDSFNKMAEELENTEMLRSDFINNFSHEFKTPIVSIAGFAKLLKKGNLTEEQQKEYIDIIEEESLRLSAMATNVLNMTKIENQNILTDVTEFNLSEQLRSSILMLEGKWSKKNIEFNLDFDEYSIFANEEMLKHIWINLIDNAIKFSEDFGTVDVKITEKEHSLCISVKNVGSEIPPEQQKRIFNKFYQADESHSTEGNGIGLALVKEVVRLHKGDVSVQSENNVTIFTVKLPKEQ